MHSRFRWSEGRRSLRENIVSNSKAMLRPQYGFCLSGKNFHKIYFRPPEAYGQLIFSVGPYRDESGERIV